MDNDQILRALAPSNTSGMGQTPVPGSPEQQKMRMLQQQMQLMQSTPWQPSQVSSISPLDFPTGATKDVTDKMAFMKAIQDQHQMLNMLGPPPYSQ